MNVGKWKKTKYYLLIIRIVDKDRLEKHKRWWLKLNDHYYQLRFRGNFEGLISMDGSINLIRNEFENYFYSRFYLYCRKFSNSWKEKPSRTDDVMKARIVGWMFDECRCTLHTSLTVHNLPIKQWVYLMYRCFL